MSEEKYSSIHKLFKLWNPFDEGQAKKILFDVARIFNAESIFLMDNQNDKETFKINEKYFFNNIKNISENFSLSSSELLIKRLLEKDDVQAVEYDIKRIAPSFLERGVKALLAASLNISKEYKSILLICSKTKRPYEVKGKFKFKYGHESKNAFSEFTKEITKKIGLVRSFNKDASLWKEALKQFDDIDAILNIAVYMIDKKKIDAAIDLFERVILIVRKDHNHIKKYTEEIENQYKNIATHYQTFINKNPPIIKGNKGNFPFTFQISSLFLRSFFLHLLIKDLLSNDTIMKSINPSEKLNFLRHFGTAIKFYLNQVQDVKDDNIKAFEKSELDLAGFTNSICHLIGEYAHEVAGVERFFDIEGHLRNFIASQTVLYSLKSRYRDHIFHMIDICFFGLFLLKSKVGNKTLIDKISKNKMEKTKILKNWFIASLLHDLGYVLNIYDYIHEEPSYISSDEINELKKRIHEATQKAIRGSKDDSEDYKGYIDKSLKRLEELGVKVTKTDNLNHGTASALHIANLIDKSLPDKERSNSHKEKLFKYYHPAISAMTKHDLEEENVNFKDEPVGFLLCLCDELQDWERPSLDILPFKEQIAAAIRFGTYFSIESSTILNVIRLKLKKDINPYTDKGNLSDTNNLYFVLDYSPAVDEKDFNPFYSWLLKSYKLQRLNQQDILNINIEFITGVKRSLPEFSRLSLKRHKAKEWSFEDWIKLVKDSYRFDGREKERLVIRLKDLWKNMPIKKNPIKFLEEITKAIIDEDG